MSGTFVIIDLLGGIALLLWGVRMVKTGIMRAYGDRLHLFLEQRLGNRLTAFGGGLVATAILGSATAMALIVSGLAGSGALSATTGLAVLLGADVGSALISAVLASGSSSAAALAPLLLFVGYLTFGVAREFRPRNIGRVLLGLGLMLISLKLVVGATAPLREASLFHEALAAVSAEPVLGFFVGAVLAWLCHSTLAVVLLISSFVLSGSLDMAGALPFILGLNFGGGLPAITATMDQPAAARRLPLANMACRGALAIAGLAAARPLTQLLAGIPVDDLHVVVAIHAGFNVLAAAIFLPLAPLVVGLVGRFARDPDQAEDPLARPRYLDRAALDTPAIALSNAAMETVRMSELLSRMLAITFRVLETRKLEMLKEIAPIDARLGNYLNAIHAYIGELSQNRLSPQDARRAFEIILYASNLEHAGDVIKLNLADRIKSKVKQNVEFSAEQARSLQALTELVNDCLRLVPGAVTSRDLEAATRLAAHKDLFRKLEDRVIDDHLNQDAATKRVSLRASALFVDLVRDLHRINSHVAAAGYPVIEAAGLLNETRLKGA
ncbi:Na/Pi cotransporter family protein [Devosia ginsengisoli]|uniref:Na/Pi cotransporter family protein n=1 Tax=Devosia ginsengisoli TaxID=400770 RepID=A0A5B8LXS2_9HYPH|nr:Na/Pi cotransporter family protein [Devosia ginsengisoli]QDZ12611.1 Na/Pi cotransporter family protein [Devosia ginsengisoli]